MSKHLTVAMRLFTVAGLAARLRAEATHASTDARVTVSRPGNSLTQNASSAPAPAPRRGICNPVDADADRAEDEIGFLNRQPSRVSEKASREREPQGSDRTRDRDRAQGWLPARAKPWPLGPPRVRKAERVV
jgi:hypothetical protein